MKIAFMAYDKPNYFGGPITNARRLLPELQKRGHQVHAMIFYHGGYAPTAEYLKSQGVQCHLLPKPHYTEAKITWILKQLKKIKPDIFVPNIFVSGWYAAKWAQAAGIPAIAALRSDDDYHWGMVNEFVVGQPEWSLAGLVCVSHYLKERVEQLAPKHTKLCMIPSGVPIPEESSCPIEPLKIAYVGRLVQQQKRIRDTLEALITVCQKLPDISVTFFGEGNEHSYLEQRVQQVGLSHKIQFVGGVPSEYLHQRLVKYNVLVLLSDYEGTPGAVMDGMACGLVPVCTDIAGGVQELVIHGQTGLLVRHRSQDFLRAIQMLYDNPELRIKLGHNARQHIMKEYSLSVATERWESFCQKLIAEAQPQTQIYIPHKYNLPAVRQGLDREDRRQPSFIYCLLKNFYQFLKKIKIRLISML